MRLPNGYGSVVKMSGKRRKPYMVRKTIGWHLDETKGRQIQDFQIIGYAETRAEGLRMLAEYNQNPYDVNVAKVTFSEVYERWSKYKYPIISDSNAKGYTASYKVCGILYDKPFREIKLCDLQLVVDTCGKNYPTLKKLKGLFNQVYEYAMKNDICNKDYSQYVDLTGYRNKNPNKRDRNIFSKDELARLWAHEANPYCQIILIRMIANLAFDPSLPAMVYIEKRTVRTTLKVGGTFFQVHIAIHHKSAIKNFVGCHGSLAALVKKLQDNAILSFNDIFNI